MEFWQLVSWQRNNFQNYVLSLGGVLDCNMEGELRRAKINSIVKEKARKMDDFFFMDEDLDWVDGD